MLPFVRKETTNMVRFYGDTEYHAITSYVKHHEKDHACPDDRALLGMDKKSIISRKDWIWHDLAIDC